MNRERENLHQLASERIKFERLAQNRAQLQRNLDEHKEAVDREMREYILRQKMEQEMSAREREIKARERRERLAKEREEREKMARERVAGEKAAKGRDKRMREEIERMERQRELRE